MVDHYKRRVDILRQLREELTAKDKIYLPDFLVGFEIRTGVSPNSAMRTIQKWSDCKIIGKIREDFVINEHLEKSNLPKSVSKNVLKNNSVKKPVEKKSKSKKMEGMDDEGAAVFRSLRSA